MLSIQKLSHVYSGGVRALDGLDLEIPPGMFGLLGPNGAGKSTLMRCIATLQTPTGGTIRFGDIDVIREPEGGAHVDPACAMQMVNERLERHFAELTAMPIETLLAERYNKFRNIAQFYQTAA